jgi:hypothetical protein
MALWRLERGARTLIELGVEVLERGEYREEQPLHDLIESPTRRRWALATVGRPVPNDQRDRGVALTWGQDAWEARVYDSTPAHAFLRMLDPKNGLAPGDPARMAAGIISSVDREPAPLRMILGSDALRNTLTVLKARVAAFEAQTEIAASTDFPPGE